MNKMETKPAQRVIDVTPDGEAHVAATALDAPNSRYQARSGGRVVFEHDTAASLYPKFHTVNNGPNRAARRRLESNLRQAARRTPKVTVKI